MGDPDSPWGLAVGYNGGGPGYAASAFHTPDLGGATACALGAFEEFWPWSRCSTSSIRWLRAAPADTVDGGHPMLHNDQSATRTRRTMRRADLARLYDYSCWANRRLLDVAATLTPDELTRPVAGSYGSVRNTLVHVLSAEWGWLERCGGLTRGARLNAEDFPTLESIAVAWARVEAAMRDLLARLADDALSEWIEFSFGGPTRSVPRSEVLQHVVLHAVHHRGQVALLLRELARTPGDVDFLFYAAEHGGTSA